MTAGVQLHGVSQSAAAVALPCSAKPEVSAEQRAPSAARQCVSAEARGIYLLLEGGREDTTMV